MFSSTDAVGAPPGSYVPSSNFLLSPWQAAVGLCLGMKHFVCLTLPRSVAEHQTSPFCFFLCATCEFTSWLHICTITKGFGQPCRNTGVGRQLVSSSVAPPSTFLPLHYKEKGLRTVSQGKSPRNKACRGYAAVSARGNRVPSSSLRKQGE